MPPATRTNGGVVPPPATKPATTTAAPHGRKVIFGLVLPLAILASFLTILARQSDDVVRQVLRQEEWSLPGTNATTKTTTKKTMKRVVVVEESYGYDTIGDDVEGGNKKALFGLEFWNKKEPRVYMAAYYEYKLPRAILQVSQHRERITLREGEELLYRSGWKSRKWKVNDFLMRWGLKSKPKKEKAAAAAPPPHPPKTKEETEDAKEPPQSGAQTAPQQQQQQQQRRRRLLSEKETKKLTNLNPTLRLKDRNVFLDEPLKDRRVHRLFARSYKTVTVGLVVGILSMLGLIFVDRKMHNTTATATNKKAGATNHINGSSSSSSSSNSNYRGCGTPIHKALASALARCSSSLPFDGKHLLWLKRPIVIVHLVVVALLASIALAGVLSSLSIRTLLRSRLFCPGHGCASSLLLPTTLLEVDACIDGCLLGEGGKLIAIASRLWFLDLVFVSAIVFVTEITLLSSSSGETLSRLSRKWWWKAFCLPFAVRQDKLYQLVLPLVSSQHERDQDHEQ